MADLTRITVDQAVTGGQACIRGLGVTVLMVLDAVAAGRSRSEILNAYSYLEDEDIDAVVSHAAL